MRRTTTQIDDQYLIRGIRNGDRQAFADLFDTYYVSLVMFCGTYIPDLESCRDIVSKIFLDLWTNGSRFNIDKSLKSYLLGMVRNRALNDIRHKNIENKYFHDVIKDGILASHDVDNYILYSEMKSSLEKTIETMPEKIGQAFRCYIEDGMKTKEIAIVQEVSQRTVELRIKKALEILKHSLAVFALILGLWII